MSERLDPSHRRLNIADIMGLVVAMALSAFFLRTCFLINLFAIESSSSPGAEIMDVCGIAGGCLLIPFAFVLPLLGIRDDRTPRREAVQKVGFVSCVVVALSAVQPFILFVSRSIYAAQQHTDFFHANFQNSFLELRMQAGPAILVLVCGAK